MTEFLETTIDKFIFKVAMDRFYSSEGLWAQAEGNRICIGLSDFLQQRSGDVAFAEVKPLETGVVVGEEVASIETIKVTISLSSPVAGRVVARSRRRFRACSVR
jgi:glycine cleavage system H protein